MDFSTPFLSLVDRDLDPEYRKYMLLAFLQRIGQRFREKRLYPYLNELKKQYTEFLSFRGKKEEMHSSFPRELSGIDLEKQQLYYRTLIHDEEFIEEIDRIVEMSLPRIKEELDRGEDLRNSVMEHVEIRPVGLLPLHKREGYLLLSRSDEWRVYRYRLNFIQHPSVDKRYKDLRTHYIDSFPPIHGPESIKDRLMKERTDWPNPAVFWIESDLLVPHVETLLPIAKQVLMHLLERAE